MENRIRPVVKEDIAALKIVIDSSGLFPSELLDEMIQPYFLDKESREYWLTYLDNSIPQAVAYFAPERMTNGTYNLYLIAVGESLRGRRVGEKMLQYIENFLREKGERILLVETSGLPEFERTRTFYKRNSYTVEARVREFYDKGDDKIIFWKALN